MKGWQGALAVVVILVTPLILLLANLLPPRPRLENNVIRTKAVSGSKSDGWDNYTHAASTVPAALTPIQDIAGATPIPAGPNTRWAVAVTWTEDIHRWLDAEVITAPDEDAAKKMILGKLMPSRLKATEWLATATMIPDGV